MLELVIRQTGSEAAKLSADRAEVVARSEGAGAGVIKVNLKSFYFKTFYMKCEIR